MIEQLRKEIFERGYDQESKEWFKAQENRLIELTAKEHLKDLPAFREWIDYLSAKVIFCEDALKTDRNATDTRRIEWFITMDLARQFLNFFEDGAKEKLEKELERALNNAKSPAE